MPPFFLILQLLNFAGNKIELTRRTGTVLPSWIADQNGVPIMEEIETPDRADTIATLRRNRENGSHKGFGLGFVGEMMTNILSGAGPGIFNDHQGSDFFVAYSIDAFTE